MAQNDTTPQDKSIVFSKKEQIVEILTEAERLKIQVLIKYTNTGKAVRGSFERVSFGENSIRLANISAAGTAALSNIIMIRLEFVLLSKKIYFLARIKARATAEILIDVPAKIFAIERRCNSRFQIPRGHSSFAKFYEKYIDHTRFDAPVSMELNPHSKEQIPRFLLDDISLGGAALFTRFSSLVEKLQADTSNIYSTLLLPKVPPIFVPVSIRWIKKSKIRVFGGQHEQVRKQLSHRLAQFWFNNEFNEIYYRIGIQFSEVSPELDVALKEYIHTIQTAESL